MGMEFLRIACSVNDNMALKLVQEKYPVDENLIISDELRPLISASSAFADIRKYADKAGFRAMRYDGIKKVIRGLTTIDEDEK